MQTGNTLPPGTTSKRVDNYCDQKESDTEETIVFVDGTSSSRRYIVWSGFHVQGFSANIAVGMVRTYFLAFKTLFTSERLK